MHANHVTMYMSLRHLFVVDQSPDEDTNEDRAENTEHVIGQMGVLAQEKK